MPGAKEKEEFCDEGLALAVLLAEEVCFINERDTIFEGIPENNSTTVVYVCCNDVFYWATADGERLPNDEIGKLYRMHRADAKHGATKWCCLRRKLRPQVPLVEMMKEDGSWDADLEALEAPEPS